MTGAGDPSQIFQALLHFDQQLGGAIPRFGVAIYAILFAIVYCEIGLAPLFFLPGDPLIFIGGAFCATGVISIWILVPVFAVAAVAGSLTAYGVGRSIGHQILQEQRPWLSQSALQRGQAFFDAHGRAAFLISPFIAVVRTFAPLLAGAAKMAFGQFALFASGGAVIWAVTLTVSGYFFGNVPVIRNNMGSIVLVGVAGGVGALLLGSLTRAVKSRVKHDR